MAIFENGVLSRVYRKILHKFYVNDIWIDLRLAAKKEAVDYVLTYMQGAHIARDRYGLLTFALVKAAPQGLVLEFGVEKGLSINHLGAQTSRTIHGFDSFEGIPADWSGTMETKGKFTMKGKLPRVPANVRLHVGWFDKSLPDFLQRTAEKVALLHIDCDIYEATKVVLDTLKDRITTGTVIVFDEYFNYPGWRLHEFKAFQEFIASNGHKYRYIGLSAEKGHVAVEIQ